MNINERISAVIDRFENGKKKAFAEKVGLPVSTLQNIVGERGSDPTFKILNRIISAYPEVSIRWLMTDDGSITEGRQENQNDEEGPPVSNRDCKICLAKDETIAILKQHVAIQADYIDTLKSISSQNPDEQKRKAG